MLQTTTDQPTVDAAPTTTGAPPTAHGHAVLRATPVEPRWSRVAYTALAVVVAVGFFLATHAYWAPAHSGVDQNGYLVGARQFAHTLSMGLTPPDPFSFVGRMWIGTETGTYYPKYPLGLPFLYAVMLWFGGETSGVTWVHSVSPVSMALALLGSFVLFRRFVPDFHAILGTLILATGPVTLQLTNNPNSHAATLCCVVWGMVLLVQWWHTGGLWTARGAGLLIGYATTIRYTEGLLLLPLLLVILFRLHEHYNRKKIGAGVMGERPIRECLTLLAWWLLPIFLLLTFNRYWFGDWTGYDSTNESTGFSGFYLLDNVETMLRQLHTTALFFTLPLGVLGLMLMAASRRKLAVLLAAWAVPSIALYTSYYWAPDNTGNAVGYMRFFLTVLPPLILAAMWLLNTSLAQTHLRPGTAAAVIAMLCVAAVASGVLLAVRYQMYFHGWSPGATQVVLWLAVPAALTAGVAWFAQRHDRLLAEPARALAIAVPALVAVCACGAQLYNAVPALEAAGRQQASLHEAGRHLMRLVPAGSVVLGPDHALHHLQLIGDHRLYTTGTFTASEIRKLGEIDPAEPNPLQRQRAAFLYDLFNDESDARLAARQFGIIRRALGRDERVFFIGNRNTVPEWKKRVDHANRSRKKDQPPLTPAEELDQLTTQVLRVPQAAKDLQVRVADRWIDAPEVRDAADLDPKRPRGPAARRQAKWQPPNEWVLLEVVRKPPAPPATAPTTTEAR